MSANDNHRARPGVVLEPDGARFRVWAPSARRVELVCDGESHAMGPIDHPVDAGYFEAAVPGARAGSLYGYRLDDGPLWPDPASRFQPGGVHELSEVIDLEAFTWSDRDWQGVAQPDLVFYELHIGTFSAEGTYNGVRQKLSYLRDLGVTAIELLPVCDFPGRWNWGYDPAALWAPSRAYGRPEDLCALIDAAHQAGLAVFLDVVYNHLGPDGAYLANFGPIFEKRHTPWGRAINLDGRGSHGVRQFVLENALFWLDDYHIDGLRLDATFFLFDDGPKHLLAELAERARDLPGPERVLIAEDPRHCDWVIRPPADGGYGLHGVWADDFHHIMRRTQTGDDYGPYRGFPDTTAALARCVDEGWYLAGWPAKPGAESQSQSQSGKLGHQYLHGHVPPGFGPGQDGRRPSEGLALESFVICIQNHDQIGNRARGQRLHRDIDPSAFRALSALLLLAPQLPLMFMGQEWAASTPFLFFTDHNETLGRQVREGRKREFADAPGFDGVIADPQDPATFEQSKLDWSELGSGAHRKSLSLYRDLLTRRRQLTGPSRAHSPIEGAIVIERGEHLVVIALRPDLRIDLGDDSRELIWHSEYPAYSDSPRPPLLQREGEGTMIELEVPAAVLLR